MSSRHNRRRTAAIAAAAGAALAAGIVTAPAASAHTPRWTVDCSVVSVNLLAYNPSVTNTVTIKVGEQDLLATQEFGRQFQQQLELPKHTNPVDVRLIVKAGDGDRYSVDQTKSSPVCEGDTQPEPTDPEPAPEPSSAAPVPPEEPEKDAPEVEPAGDSSKAPVDLAETGSSSATPVIAGVAGGVLAIGAVLLLVSRKRRSAQH